MYVKIDSLIENTECEARIENETIVSYKIAPSDGYKLHEITLDTPKFDMEGNEIIGEIIRGFTKSYITIGPNYDFDINERQIYTEIDE